MVSERYSQRALPSSFSLELLADRHVEQHDKTPPELHKLKGPEIVAWYRTTSQYRARLQQLQCRQWPMDHQACEKLHQRLAGAAFEDLAYSFLDSQIEDDEILLTPAETFAFFRERYVGTTQYYEFENRDILGVSVPDGLLIRRSGKLWSVKLVCEYTASNDYDYLVHAESRKSPAREHFTHDMPTVFGNHEVAYVVPKDSTLRKGFEARSKHVLPTPITYRNFRNLIALMNTEVGMNLYLAQTYSLKKSSF